MSDVFTHVGHTLYGLGEWQCLGKGYRTLRNDDEAGQSPGQIMHTFVFTYTASLDKLVINLELQCMCERSLRR